MNEYDTTDPLNSDNVSVQSSPSTLYASAQHGTFVKAHPHSYVSVFGDTQQVVPHEYF